MKVRNLLIGATLTGALATGFAVSPAQTTASMADVPAQSIAHVWLDLVDRPSGTQRANYSRFLESLRAAAGHSFRNGVLETQTQRENRLIRVDVNTTAHRLILWVTPHNLYVRGYTTENGDSFAFNDADYDLWRTMATIGPNSLINPPVAQANTALLRFGSSYTQLHRAADINRQDLNIRFSELTSAVNTLATADNPYGSNSQGVARALMFMIQYTSEAARFNDVANIFASIMQQRDLTRRLPPRDVALENAWDPISDYALRVSQNPRTSPLDVPSVANFSSINDVAARVAIILGNPDRRIPVIGDPSHTEL